MTSIILPNDAFQGDNRTFQGEANTTPGTEQTLVSVTLSENVNLKAAQVKCNMEGRFRIFHDGSLIGSGRTGPADRNALHLWLPEFPALDTKLVELKFTAELQTAIVPVEAFISGRAMA